MADSETVPSQSIEAYRLPPCFWDDIKPAIPESIKSYWNDRSKKSLDLSLQSENEFSNKIESIVEILRSTRSVGIACGSGLSLESCRQLVRLARVLDAEVFDHSDTLRNDWSRFTSRNSLHTCTIGELRRRADLICFAGANDDSEWLEVARVLFGAIQDDNGDEPSKRFVSFGTRETTQAISDSGFDYSLDLHFIQEVRFAIRQARDRKIRDALAGVTIKISSEAAKLAHQLCCSSYAAVILDSNSHGLTSSWLHQLFGLANDLRPQTRLHVLTLEEKSLEEVCSWNGISLSPFPDFQGPKAAPVPEVVLCVGDHTQSKSSSFTTDSHQSKTILIGQIADDSKSSFEHVLPTPIDGTTQRHTHVRFDGVPITSKPVFGSESVMTTAEILKIISSRLLESS